MSIDTSIQSANTDVMRANGRLNAARLHSHPAAEIEQLERELATAHIVKRAYESRRSTGPLDAEQVARVVEACTAT